MEMPTEWKYAKICAIHKKGKKTLPANYRPVSLTSTVCKVLEFIFRDAIVKHMKKNNLLSQKQFGFIDGRSTSLQLLHVLNIWMEELDQGGSPDAIYCDFMKAFDKVPHMRLAYKIQKYGITGNMLGWIKSFLSERTQCVNIKSATPYYMDHHELRYSPCENDLGVYIDDELNFEKHIGTIVNKANRVLGITRKTFDHMDQNIFCHIFKGLVRPQLEYASSVWSPHLVKRKETIENVQRRATQLIPGFSELSYPDRLKKLKLPTLAYRRVRGDMIQVYKMLCDTGGFDKTLPSILTDEPNRTLRGHNKKLFTERFHKDIGKYAFKHRIVSLWNSLPDAAVNAQDIETFEKELDKHWNDQELKCNNFKAAIKSNTPTKLHRYGKTPTP